MADNTYKITEVVGTSSESVHQAIRNGVSKTSETVRDVDWFEVTEIRGHVEGGEVAHFQVSMKIGFKLEA